MYGESLDAGNSEDSKHRHTCHYNLLGLKSLGAGESRSTTTENLINDQNTSQFGSY